MTHKPPQGIDARCRYRYSNGTECNAEIVTDLTSPSGHMHAAGRDWLHWASPKAYGPQDSKAAFVSKMEEGKMGIDAGLRDIEQEQLEAEVPYSAEYLRGFEDGRRAAPPDPRKDLVALEELVEECGLSLASGEIRCNFKHVETFDRLNKLRERLAEMRGAKR